MSKETKKKEKSLNIKQKAFLSEYLKCFNATEAYEKVYKCSRETALTNGPALLGNARIKELINKWLDEIGFSDERLKIKVLSLMEAKTTKFFQHEGEITDQAEVEDNTTQAKMTEIALKMKGLLTEKIEHSGEIKNIHDLSDKTKELAKVGAKAILEAVKNNGYKSGN